jgi:hypothetical protein
MLVKLDHPWFAPSDVVQKDKIQTVSGRRYREGVQEIPDNLKAYLPKSAEILKDIPEEKIEPVETDLKAYDTDRDDADREAKVLDAAEKERLKALNVKRDVMANARAAKEAKRSNPSK